MSLEVKGYFIYVGNGVFEHPVVVMNVFFYFDRFCRTVQNIQNTVIGKCKGSRIPRIRTWWLATAVA